MFLKKLLAMTACVAMMAGLVWVAPVLADFNEGIAKSGTDDYGSYIEFGPAGGWGYTTNNVWLNSDEHRIGIFGDYYVGNDRTKYDNTLSSGEHDGWIALKAKPDTVLTRFDINVNVGSFDSTPRKDAVIEFFSDEAATAPAVYSDTVNGEKSYDLAELGLANTIKSFKLYMYTGAGNDWSGSSCRYIKFWYDDEIDQSKDSIRIKPNEVTAASGDRVNFTAELFGPNKDENTANLLWSVSSNALPGTSISDGILTVGQNEPDFKVLTVTAYVPDTDLSATATVTIINETFAEFNAPYTRDASAATLFGSYYAGGGTGWGVNWDSQLYQTEVIGSWFAIKTIDESKIISKVELTYSFQDGGFAEVSGYTDYAATERSERDYFGSKTAGASQLFDILGSGNTNTKSVRIAYNRNGGWSVMRVSGIKVYFVPKPPEGGDEITLSYDEGAVTVTGDNIPSYSNLIVASYVGNRLLDAKVIYYGDDDVEGGIWTPSGFNTVGSDKIKVMLWDPVTLAPLAEAFDSSK